MVHLSLKQRSRQLRFWQELLAVVGSLILIGMVMVVPVAAQQGDIKPIKAGPFEVSGSLRLRYENWGWFDVPNRDSQHDFLGGLFRLQVASKYKVNETNTIDWQIETSVPFLVGLPRNAVAPAPQGAFNLGGIYAAANVDERAAISLKQAFFRWRHTKDQKTTSFRIGRFEYSDGSELQPADGTLAALKRQRINERLLGPFGFTHATRSFDGVHFGYGTAFKNLTVVAALPTEGVFQVDSLRTIQQVGFVYGAYSQALHPTKVQDKTVHQGEFRAFALYYRDNRNIVKTDNRPLPVRQTDFADISIMTLGGHYVRTAKIGSGKADLLLWGAGQFGDWGKLNHHAGAGAVEIGYQPKMKWNPWMRGGFFRSTGDQNPNDKSHGTFFQILPTPRGYARTPFFNLMNNQDIFGQVTLRPNKKFTLRSDFHHLQLSSRQDLWFAGGGAFQQRTFGYAGRPSNGSRALGALLDVSADYQINPHVSFTLYYGQMFGGNVVRKIYPTGQNGHFGYAEMTFRF
ncbi:MAG: alginate export family protein [Blastocatellia bacterium]|nr:alginate export family protein [Blastocatellia bacterium]